jgi:hypothetical protein
MKLQKINNKKNTHTASQTWPRRPVGQPMKPILERPMAGG